jgi:hypothetical protein
MLNEQQFTIYRGLRTFGADPSDDEAVRSKIQHKPVTPDFNDRAVSYGSHWTTNPETARRFALHAITNLEHRGPGAYSTRPRTGVVLEAKVSKKPEQDHLSSGYGEHEVAFPGQLPIESMHAHVHHLPAGVSVNRHDTFLRSLNIR